MGFCLAVRTVMFVRFSSSHSSYVIRYSQRSGSDVLTVAVPVGIESQSRDNLSQFRASFSLLFHRILAAFQRESASCGARIVSLQ